MTWIESIGYSFYQIGFSTHYNWSQHCHIVAVPSSESATGWSFSSPVGCVGCQPKGRGVFPTQRCCCWQKKKCNYIWAMLFSFSGICTSLTYGTVSLFTVIYSKSSLSTPNTLRVKAGRKLFLKGELPMRPGLGFRTSEWELPTETRVGQQAVFKPRQSRDSGSDML